MEVVAKMTQDDSGSKGTAQASSPVKGAEASPAPNEVVAVVLESRGRIAVLRRSGATNCDHYRWHCVTGFVEDGLSPREQAMIELSEETGLRRIDVTLMECAPLCLPDAGGRAWLIHTFEARTSRRHLRLNWENTAYRWTSLAQARAMPDRVSWLDDVLNAAYPEAQVNRESRHLES